ncbi:MAG TPA: hypothetical protein VMB46_00035 [Methanomassiliicoccales archaeon]|nr:hypothetical protein [Methanomassiliicoccales archaeon]
MPRYAMPREHSVVAAGLLSFGTTVPGLNDVQSSGCGSGSGWGGASQILLRRSGRL